MQVTEMTARELLDDIFSVMQRLYDEIHLRKNGMGSHERVFDIFAELGRTLAGADRASFWRWDRSAHKLVTTTATGTDQIIIDENAGMVGQALTENRPILTNDPYNHPNFNPEVDKQTGYVTKSVLVLPVANCRGETIGAFQVINKLDGNGFNEAEDVKRLSIAAFICGMALESDLFLADSERDKLTELKNRFGFHSDCRTKYRNLFGLTNTTDSVSLIICDIDFFKKVNDTYGHNAGDAVLMHVAGILKSEIRAGDSAYRWGGEEFVIVLEGSGLKDARLVAERIRRAVEKSVCRHDKQEIRVTMSFGCAKFEPERSVEENIQVADRRLYRAKESGRNRVIAEDA